MEEQKITKDTGVKNQSSKNNKQEGTTEDTKKQTNIRILGVLLNSEKQVFYSIQSVYGIGSSLANKFLQKAGIEKTKKTHELTEDEQSKLQKVLEESEYKFEGDLKQQVYNNINSLRMIKSYRGIRHKLGLPVRGQKTRKNARTRKGKVKMAVGGLNKPISKK